MALLPYIEPRSLLRDGQSLLSNDGRRFGMSDRMTVRRAALWIGNQKPDPRHVALGSTFLVWATVPTRVCTRKQLGSFSEIPTISNFP